MMYTLGIETSCDDTSLALVNAQGQVQALQKWTADQDHRPFGGVIPERASRNHLKSLIPVLENLFHTSKSSWEQVEAIAVTNRPGLLGALIVGTLSAESLSWAFNKPLIPINHLEGHMYSPWLYKQGQVKPAMEFPQLCLLASGGHTQLVLLEELGRYKLVGATRDDAVGEALDKFSNLVGLGFPGGAAVDRAAQEGNPKAYEFPRPMIYEPHFDMSFSGLKASGARLVERLKTPLSEQVVCDLCASYLEAAVDVLESKLKKALEVYAPRLFTVAGGVSANSFLRTRLETLSQSTGVPFYRPELKYCTDNGAMIALAGALRFHHLKKDSVMQNAQPWPRSLKGDFI